MKFEEEFKKIFPDNYEEVLLKKEQSGFDNLEEFLFFKIQEYFLFNDLNENIEEIKIIEIKDIFQKKIETIK